MPSSVDPQCAAAAVTLPIIPVLLRLLQDAVFLARALEFNDTLTTLNFTHNPIGEVRPPYLPYDIMLLMAFVFSTVLKAYCAL